MPQLELQQNWPALQVLLPHLPPTMSGTHSAIGSQGVVMQTIGVTSQWVPARQRTAAQGSFTGGSSSATQEGCAGQGARMHCTCCSLQCSPGGHSVPRHEGAGMH
jgi:hypothetical protein